MKFLKNVIRKILGLFTKDHHAMEAATLAAETKPVTSLFRKPVTIRIGSTATFPFAGMPREGTVTRIAGRRVTLQTTGSNGSFSVRRKIHKVVEI